MKNEQDRKCKAFEAIFTILDNILTVGESAGVKNELAGLTLI
jgi:hypothetical protein